CGDCGSPMFAMSRSDLKPAYRCGTYHRQGLKACTSHHIRVDKLDDILKLYIQKVRDNSAEMLEQLNADLAKEEEDIKEADRSEENLEEVLVDLQEELKATKRQRIRDIMKHPEREELLEETYDELEDDLTRRIAGLQNQIELTVDRRNTIIRVNRTAKLAMDVFDDILSKEKLDRNDLQLIIEKIYVYEDHIDIKLKADIDSLLRCGILPEETEAAANFESGIIDSLSTVIVQPQRFGANKVYDVNIISDGDPLEIYTATDGEVIFKKYSPVGELSEFAGQYADVIARISSMPTLICDTDHVIAAAGVSKREYLERRVSSILESYMDNRKSYAATNQTLGSVQPIEGVERDAAVIYPIIASGDVMGAVVMLTGDTAKIPTNVETKLAQSAAAFLGKQMEE
ncbi:MAG: recombinase zinc beta ribbon domain-containing protein, partial [Ruminococcus sp.]|nr:recombinase zinc beta ribbon domain-containing protein [Ruminococcus sp.]